MKVGLIHAAMHPVEVTNEALKRLWPEAEAQNIVDDGFYAAIANGAHPDDLSKRFGTLLRYLVDCGVDVVIFTSSAFGPSLEAAIIDAPVPVITTNRALIEDIKAFSGRVALIATFEQSLKSILPDIPKEANVIAHYVHGALDAYERGDFATHDSLIAADAKTIVDCDAFAFVQFSLARSVLPVVQATGLPVFTSLESAILKARGHFA